MPDAFCRTVVYRILVQYNRPLSVTVPLHAKTITVVMIKAKNSAEIIAKTSLDRKLVYVFSAAGFRGLDERRVPGRNRTQRSNHFSSRGNPYSTHKSSVYGTGTNTHFKKGNITYSIL